MLTETESDPTIKLNLPNCRIRFSDPVSSDALAEIESEIVNKSKKSKYPKISYIIAVTTALVEERNKKAKILK